MLQNQNDNCDNQTDSQIFQRAVVICTRAAAERADTNADQRQTDGQYDRTGDNRREKAAQRLEECAQNGLKQTADNRGAHHRAVGDHTAAHYIGDTAEHADKSGAGTHDNRYLTADRTDRKQLDQCNNTRYQHRILQQRYLNRGKILCSADRGTGIHDDQQRRQIADKHRQHVLQSERDRLLNRNPSLKFMRR